VETFCSGGQREDRCHPVFEISDHWYEISWQ
jgi:hypothetical protein